MKRRRRKNPQAHFEFYSPSHYKRHLTLEEVEELGDELFWDEDEESFRKAPAWLFHGTTKKSIGDPNHEVTLIAMAGDWVKQAYADEDLGDDFEDILFLCDYEHIGKALGACVFHIGLEAGSDDPWSTVTINDLTRHGVLFVTKNWKGTYKAREDQTSKSIGGEVIDSPRAVEPDDWWTYDNTKVDYVVSGKVLAELMEDHKDSGWKRLVENSK